MPRVNLPAPYQATAEKLYSEVSTRIMGKIDGWEFATGKRQIDELRAFLRDKAGELGDTMFLLEITQQDDTDRAELTPQLIIEANASEPALIKVGRSLRVIEVTRAGFSEEIELDDVKASEISEGKAIAFREQAMLVRFFADGRPAGAINPTALSSRVGRHSRFTRRAEDYEDCILDHYRERVRNWRTDHWANPREQRKLRAGLGRASRTEDIFQNALLDWFDLHLTASVKGKVGQVTSDQTDIEITAPGKLYIVEIKWLGENENGTPYNIDRVAEGLRQVRDYLEKQGKAKRGTLVVYDGRSDREFQEIENVIGELAPGCKCIHKSGDDNVPARGCCMILFLRSTTASQT